MPDPKEGESEQDFVSRCVPIVMGEGTDQDAALGACYGIYRNANKAMGTVDTRAEGEEVECKSIQSKERQRVKKVLSAIRKIVVSTAVVRTCKNLQVDATELYEGTMEELEHTDDWREAMQIAVDHLQEHGDYYTRLKAAGLMGDGEADGHEPLDTGEDQSEA